MEQCERGGKGKRERGGNEAKEQSIISAVFEGIVHCVFVVMVLCIVSRCKWLKPFFNEIVVSVLKYQIMFVGHVNM